MVLKPSIDDILRAQTVYSQLSQSDIVGNACNTLKQRCFMEILSLNYLHIIALATCHGTSMKKIIA